MLDVKEQQQVSEQVTICLKSVETLTSDDMLNFFSEWKFLCSSFPPCLQEAARGPILKSTNCLLPPVVNAFLRQMPSSLLQWTPSSFPRQVASSLNGWTPHSTNSHLAQQTAWVLSLIERSHYSMNSLVAQQMLSLLNECSPCSTNGLSCRKACITYKGRAAQCSWLQP